MDQQDSTMMRIKFTRLMQEQKFSTYTRLSIIHHIADIEKREPGDKMVTDLIEMIENGTTEQEFRRVAQEKYGVTMLG